MKKNFDIKRSVLHHVGITTGKIDEMILWYSQVLGTKINFEKENPAGNLPGVKGAWITNDKANHRIALIGIPGLQTVGSGTPHSSISHLAFEYDSLDDLLDTYIRLRDIGIKPIVTADQGISIAFYYKDPDGNTVELTMDTFGDWDKSTSFMQTAPSFSKLPMGKYVDVEKMLEAREQGASSDELHDRAYAGEFIPDYDMDPSKLF
ncbi:biphenyl-2,3-diol 1,2-dioxygenase [Paenibacillus taichungensis]|uniref:Biphenyl-2,3-diol 1,2-dioxygenase n=1 Tax=Paenibacillus taichungensis TaxID=484184 RepID=A0ABX2MG30_9BACL|nr:VOC family protein [Paenibacillus taichungensis]NUU52694.1 biphenyl-2,3-diol 1,2-dioxygenase [Paenibacillus taichungensis]